MDEDTVILAAILREIQEAKLHDLSARMVRIFESLGKLAHNHWLKRRPQPGGDDVLYGSQLYWKKVREFLEMQDRSEQPPQTDEARDSSLNSVSNGPVTLKSLTWLAEEAVNLKRPRHYRDGARQNLELQLRRARSETASSEGRVAFEAMRLIAELTVSMGSMSSAVRVERDNVSDPCELEAEELPSLTKRSENSSSEWEIRGEFEKEQLREASLERLQSIGGPVAVNELSSRLASSPHPMKCQILRILAELASQPYEVPEELTLRLRHKKDVEAVLDRLVDASQSSDRCGLFDTVIGDVEEYWKGIPNGGL